MPNTGIRFKLALIILLFYILLAALALYNPILHLDTHLTGDPPPPTTDFYHTHWNYWWMRHALTTPGLSVYETDYVMAPFTTDLAYHTLTPFWFPLWALLEPLAGTVAAMTAIFVVSMALSGFLYYLLLRREGVLRGLALVGGALLAVSPMMFVGAYWTNPNVMGWFWLPALLLIWDRIVQAVAAQPRSAALWSIILGVALWGMVLTDLQYPLFVAWLVVPYGLRTLWRARDHAVQLALWVGLAAGIALVLLWVAGPLSHILAYDRGTLESTPVKNAVSIPFPEGFITRTEDFGARVSLGSLPLALVGIALALNLLPHPLAPSPTRLERGNRLAERNWLGGEASRWFWLALSVPPLILSAGGSITVAGVEIPLPYRALHAILGGMFRYPERFAPVFLIAAGVFALQTLTPLLVNRPVWRRVIPAALVLLVLVDARVLKPFPIQPQPPEYNFYAAMGREPYQYVVVEAPTGVSTGEGLVGEAVYATTQFYGLIHGKRMVNGHFSRVDSGHYWYLRTDDVLLSWLGQRRLLEPEQAADRLRAIIYGYPVGYIVVHTDWIDRYTGRSTTQEVVGYLNSLPELVCPVAVEDTAGKIAIAYRTAWHPDDCPARTPPEIAPGVYQIDVGNLDDAGFLGWGWHWREEIVPGLTARWTGQLDQADLYVELPRGVYTITLAAQSFNQARDLRILANGELLGTVTVPAEGLAELRVDLPAELTGDFLTLTLDYDAPEPVAGGADRDLAVMVDWVRFEQVGTVEPGP